ncbi:hypothetical protein K503DRAFT_856968 [Rhizopogon vinicolor AM-OR11-026]|uniref:Uncharacterized protein n=1 Tax=Rhizopogon vinicolor AM-OR11-026 TaxID=1314800 RepID=A0A1B7MZJ0_9AGAM|nr:hypothetical protein K503DRAFT_856968 [Rhizopogon vinicolor AM-OR11-026]
MPGKLVSSLVYMPGLGAWRETSVHVARDPAGSVKRSVRREVHISGGRSWPKALNVVPKCSDEKQKHPFKVDVLPDLSKRQSINDASTLTQHKAVNVIPGPKFDKYSYGAPMAGQFRSCRRLAFVDSACCSVVTISVLDIPDWLFEDPKTSTWKTRRTWLIRTLAQIERREKELSNQLMGDRQTL